MVSKIEIVTKSIVELQKKVTLSPWIPFLTALLVGILTMLAQYFERRSKRNQEKTKEVSEAFTKCELVLFSLKSLVKELSGQKTLSSFWHHNHEVEEEAAQSDKERSKKYYDSSIVEATAASECRSKIGILLAEYYSCVSKFNILSKSQIDTTILKKLKTDITFDDAPEFAKNLSSKKAFEIFHNNNLALSNQYLSLLEPLETINSTMDSICKKLKK